MSTSTQNGKDLVVPQNICRGLTPVLTGWDTDPTDIDHATDGSITTVTGTGTSNKGGAAVYGTVTIDFGAEKTTQNNHYIISGLFGMWSSAGGVKLWMDCSDNAVLWTEEVPMTASVTSITEKAVLSFGAYAAGRYARLKFRNDAACDAYAKIYEIVAYKVNI